jgi:hypothetical protein
MGMAAPARQSSVSCRELVAVVRDAPDSLVADDTDQVVEAVLSWLATPPDKVATLARQWPSALHLAWMTTSGRTQKVTLL